MKIKNLRLTFYLFAALIAITAGYVLIAQNQVSRSEANTPQSVGSVSVVYTDVEGMPDIKKVDLMIRTGNSQKNESISSLSFRLKVRTNGKVSLADADGQKADSIEVDEGFAQTGSWEFPFNKTQNTEGGIDIDFSAVYKEKSGFSSAQDMKLATFYIRLVGDDNAVFAFDPQFSFMYSKARPVTNIWSLDE